MTRKTVYVSTTGDDAHPGTDEKPVRTLAKGMVLAAAQGEGALVKVEIGLYEAPIALRPGVEIRGGFTPRFVRHDPLGDDVLASRQREVAKYAEHCTVLHCPGDRVVVGEKLTQPATLGDVVVIAADIPASSFGGSSYAIVVGADSPSDHSRLVLDGVKIVCGSGAPGSPGSERQHAAGERYLEPPARGGIANGAAADTGSPSPLAGTADKPHNEGWDQDYGWGGECGADSVRDDAVLVKGGKGGAAGRGDSEYSWNGYNGFPGGDGAPGGTPGPAPDGAHADAEAGSFDAGLRWVGGSGSAGRDGGDGSGGGAGGSGGTHHQRYAFTSNMRAVGGRGGDGGRGGRGGYGGGGGTYGGGSFGVVSMNVRVVASRAAIDLGVGGRGGNGGAGEGGHPGEPGQAGGSEQTTSDGALLHSNSGKGGDGKPGGDGVRGGNGAGGNGGPAIAIVLIGGAVLDQDDQDLRVSGDRPSEGGYGSEQGHAGVIADMTKFPTT